jgi:hypothetical protein
VIELERSRHSSAAIRRYFEQSHRMWRRWAAQAPEARLFVLPLAPDMLHKQNGRGGPPYGIVLPDGCADGLFAGETTMPFVSYLNWVFRNGGFPWPTDSEGQWQVTQTLARDLLPL